jgi:regulator of Ty1 transposition protein 103
MSSYTDETVRSKLSALNDSQDAIVAVAQWIMFHRCCIASSSFPFLSY